MAERESGSLHIFHSPFPFDIVTCRLTNFCHNHGAWRTE